MMIQYQIKILYHQLFLLINDVNKIKMLLIVSIIFNILLNASPLFYFALLYGNTTKNIKRPDKTRRLIYILLRNLFKTFEKLYRRWSQINTCFQRINFFITF